jgi:hypothetical protein
MTYKGKRVIYIGEGRGGGTGDDQMHRILDKDWTEVDSGEPVQWWGATIGRLCMSVAPDIPN